jgi:hypothetical protein
MAPTTAIASTLAASPLQGPAMSVSKTRRALAAYAARAVVLLVVARVELALATWLLHPGLDQLSGWLLVAGLFVLCFGVIWLVNAARIWWWLRRYPWVAWNCRAREIRRSPKDRCVAHLSFPTTRAPSTC